MEEEIQEYRKLLVTAEQRAQEDFDKTVLALSGGALGISFAFVKNIIGDQPAVYSWALLSAWIAWGFSVTCVLASYFVSQIALRHAIKQVDDNKIFEQSPGGIYSKITAVLNAFGGLLFLLGVVLMVMFAALNMG